MKHEFDVLTQYCVICGCAKEDELEGLKCIEQPTNVKAISHILAKRQLERANRAKKGKSA